MTKIYEFTLEDKDNQNMKTIELMAQEAAEDYCTHVFCKTEGKTNYEITKVELNHLPVQKDELTIVYSYTVFGYEKEKSWN